MLGSFEDDLVHDWLACLADNAWISLHYESPSLGSIGRGEVNGGGYKRVQMGFTAPSNRTIWSLDDAKFSGLTANRLTHFGIWNHQYNGKLRAFGLLTDSESGVIVAQGGGYVLHASKLALSID